MSAPALSLKRLNRASQEHYNYKNVFSTYEGKQMWPFCHDVMSHMMMGRNDFLALTVPEETNIPDWVKPVYASGVNAFCSAERIGRTLDKLHDGNARSMQNTLLEEVNASGYVQLTEQQRAAYSEPGARITGMKPSLIMEDDVKGVLLTDMARWLGEQGPDYIQAQHCNAFLNNINSPSYFFAWEELRKNHSIRHDGVLQGYLRAVKEIGPPRYPAEIDSVTTHSELLELTIDFLTQRKNPDKIYGTGLGDDIGGWDGEGPRTVAYYADNMIYGMNWVLYETRQQIAAGTFPDELLPFFPDGVKLWAMGQSDGPLGLGLEAVLRHHLETSIDALPLFAMNFLHAENFTLTAQELRVIAEAQEHMQQEGLCPDVSLISSCARARAIQSEIDMPPAYRLAA